MNSSNGPDKLPNLLNCLHPPCTKSEREMDLNALNTVDFARGEHDQHNVGADPLIAHARIQRHADLVLGKDDVILRGGGLERGNYAINCMTA